MKTPFTCRRRQCLPPSPPFVPKGRKPLSGLNSPIGNCPGQSPTNAGNSLHAHQVPRSDHCRLGGLTVPRARRCNRRVAPGRLSPAAPCGCGNPAPPWGPHCGARQPGTSLRWLAPVSERAQHPRSRATVPSATTAAGVANLLRSSRPRRSRRATGGPMLPTGAP